MTENPPPARSREAAEAYPFDGFDPTTRILQRAAFDRGRTMSQTCAQCIIDTYMKPGLGPQFKAVTVWRGTAYCTSHLINEQQR